MAAQAALIQGTIAGMKQALARYQESIASDSDDPYLQPSNRGNKLKRKAHSIKDGQTGRPKGLKVYKRSIEHAGYHRDILRRNPKRYDDDGDELADSDEDEDADARAAEENPYAEIHLEKLLIPLTSPARLPSHPSLSIAYTSPILTDMAQHAWEMLQRERKTLASAKRMMMKLRGDQTWIPCGLMYSGKDEAIFDTEKLYSCLTTKGLIPRTNGVTAPNLVNGNVNNVSSSGSRKSSQSGTELGSVSGTVNGIIEDPARELTSSVQIKEIIKEPPPNEFVEPEATKTEGNGNGEKSDVEMAEGIAPKCVGLEGMTDVPDATRANPGDEATATVDHASSITGVRRPEDEKLPDVGDSVNSGDANGGASSYPTQDDGTNGNSLEPAIAAEDDSANHLGDVDIENQEEEEGKDGEDGSQPEPRRMRTRAQAQAASEPTGTSRTESPDAWVPPEIHPLFKVPKLAIPDKDFGLPPSEADETRRLLTMYVQKQEEICRGAEKLYEGLLCADRQRSTVLKWCKAEGHVGEMSDGEDWYDKEEWGLEETLEKGHNDDEGDNNAIQGRKPRRRA